MGFGFGFMFFYVIVMLFISILICRKKVAKYPMWYIDIYSGL